LRDWISRVRHDPRFKRLKAYFLNAIGRIAMTAVDDIKEALGKEDFGKARRLLSAFLGPIGREPAQLKWARQKLALATYKDKEVQTEPALEEALQVLAGEGLKSSTDPETLGLAGAIHKRLWEITRDTRQRRPHIGSFGRRGEYIRGEYVRLPFQSRRVASKCL
jgi:hypothetical protein